MATSEKESLMIIDGMAVLFRAYYATAMSRQFMYNSQGIPTNGLYGFINHFMTAITSFQPSHIVVCWDMGSHTFRTDMYPAYKANRSAPPEELLPQFELARDVVSAFSIPNIGIKGYEADDCIGTITKLKGEKINISVLTGDHDMLQLLDEQVSVILFQKGIGNFRTETKDTFMKEKLINPLQMIDVKAFMGDAGDNYPGVKGIGEKTALKLIQQYDDVEGVLANLNKLTKGQKTNIERDIEMLHLSRKLAKIKRDVPLEFVLKQAEFTLDREAAHEKLSRIDIRGLDRLLA